MREYEELTNKIDYSNNLKKINYHYKKINDLNILKGSYLLMRMGNVKCLEYLKSINVNYDKISAENIKKLNFKILSIQTRMQIEGILKKEMSKKENVSYEEMIISVENALNRNLRDNITVAEWVAIVKAINKQNEIIKKDARPYRKK